MSLPGAYIRPVEAFHVSRRFGTRVALRDVSLSVAAGEIHALLGPNGAGKTTLLRILAGLVEPTEGTVRVMGANLSQGPRQARRLLGVVPAGDRAFYLRLTGLENLLFFARLYGLSHRQASVRAREVMREVALGDVGHLPVGKYSHGMQKRLSIARALLPDPRVLLIDEATHDLDPESSRRVRELVGSAARRGVAALWATQRVDEIRGFANTVTLLNQGLVRFAGTVPQLMSHAVARRYVLRIRNGQLQDEMLEAALNQAIGRLGVIAPDSGNDAEHFLLTIADDVVLGEALASLTQARFEVLSCREEHPEIEQAFLRLTDTEG